MLLVKLLFLVAGGGTVAGVTYTQVKKAPAEKTVVVSNNQESKIRARLEKNMDKELLKYKKQLLTTTQTENTKNVDTTKSELDTAEQELKKAYADLNTSKTDLNTIIDTLKTNYGTLQTKDTELKTALEKQMAEDLTNETKKLKKEFYDAQKAAYEQERDAIVAKINAIYTPVNVQSSSICNESTASWNPTLTNPTSEETNIKNKITAELTAMCSGLHTATTQSAANNPSTTNTNSVTTATSARESIITTITNETQKYNLKIIDIKAKENDVKMKLFHLQNKQKTYSDAKIRLQKTNNELEIIEQQIQNT